METEVTRYGSHTESRMRENCTYGSMRGSRRNAAKSVLRVAEGRAGAPARGVPLYSTHSILVDYRLNKWYNILVLSEKGYWNDTRDCN